MRLLFAGGSVEYTNWADGEPDDLVIIKQNCVYLKRERFWRWATLQCSHLIFEQENPVICQYGKCIVLFVLRQVQRFFIYIFVCLDGQFHLQNSSILF